MQHIRDYDPLLLLATAMAAKRRPAELVEVIAAIDLIQGSVPGEEKLLETISRLGQLGLLLEADGGLALTPAAQGLVEALPAKADYAERLFDLRARLAAYVPPGEAAPIQLDAAVVHAAILEQRAAAKVGGKNLLMPKPPAEKTSQARPGQRQRKPLAKKPRQR